MEEQQQQQEKNKIIQGDALQVLKTLPNESIDMFLTSPPYWRLRDYGVPNQLGLEPSFHEYIDKLVTIFDEVKRVLKSVGSCWIVLGDSYDGNKSLYMIPSRFAIAMIDRGWILRNDLIWHKGNCIPSSAKNRFTIDYEHLLFFVKSQKYYFDTQYEPMANSSFERYRYTYGGNIKNARVMKSCNSIQNATSRIYFPEKKMLKLNPRGRIKRSIWTINIVGYKEKHVAVFPEKLCETPIRAGCPAEGTVLDCFFGAGTTGLAALKLGRNFMGIELSEEYCKIARKRLEPYLLQSRLPSSSSSSSSSPASSSS